MSGAFNRYLRSVTRLLCTMCCVLYASGCQPGGLSDEWHRLEQPVAAPDFTLPRLDGSSVTLSGLRGKGVIMDFWATWCGPCRMSTPSLEAIYREHKDRPVTVLLVNAGETADEVRKWAKQRFTAPILLDTAGVVRRQYGISGIPKLFVINQQGQIVYAHSGYGGGLEQSLRAIIQELLTGEKPAHA